MATSQNGYTAAEDYDDIPSGTVVIVPNGKGLPRGIRVRKDISSAFQALLDFLDSEIEEFDLYAQGDDWGFAYRPIRDADDDDLSNHASATAGDYNAVRHPLGAENTFNSTQRAKIRAFLRDQLKGIIRWGGDYTGRKDEMHFEVVKSPAEVAKVMKAYYASTKTFVLSTFRGSVKVLGYNSGFPSHVKVVQTALREVGESPGAVDGLKRSGTTRALSRFLAKWGWPEATGRTVTFRQLDRLIWEAEKRKAGTQYPPRAEA